MATNCRNAGWGDIAQESGRGDGTGWGIGAALRAAKRRMAEGLYPPDPPALPPDPAAERARRDAKWAKMGIPPIYWGEYWDTWIADTEAKRRALKAVRELAWKTNLFLTGRNGTGKTHLAMCLAKDGATCRKLRCIGLEVKADHGQRGLVVRRYGSRRLLVLNEICMRDGATDFERELLFEIIDMRWENRLPTTLATNQTWEAFAGEYGAPIADRLRPKVVLFDWESRRKPLALPQGKEGQ